MMPAPPPPVSALVVRVDAAGPPLSLRAPPPDVTLRAVAAGCRWTYRYATANGAAVFDPGRTPCPDRACGFGLDPERAARVPVGRVVRVEAASADAGEHRLAVPPLGFAVTPGQGAARDGWFVAARLGLYPGRPDPACGGAPAPAFLAVEDDAFQAWLDALEPRGEP